MKSRAANIHDYKKIVGFNKEIYPKRPNSEEYIRYRLLENPNSDQSLDSLYISESEKGHVIAQSVTLPEKITFKNKVFEAYWGQDYFVKEEYRKYAVGIELAKLFLKRDFYFGMNMASKAFQLQRRLGCKVIGQLDYFYKYSSFFLFIRFLFRRILKLKNPPLQNYNFPETFNYQKNKFKLITTKKDFKNPNLQWNDDVIETLRDKEFIEWRFLFKKNKYFIYQMEGTDESVNPNYFVVRPVQWKAVNCLLVVDYRFNLKKDSDFQSILKAINCLAKKLNLYAIVISSSLLVTNEYLLKNKYKKFKGGPVISTFPFEHKENLNKINNNFIVSLADSDAEYYFSKGEFVYA